MKVNYVRKGTGTRTTIVIPDHLCQLWFATTPSDAVKRDTQRIKERLEQLDAPSEGEPFQRLAESALVADIEAYQARLLASGEQMKVRVIEALLPWLQGAVEPTASAGMCLRRLRDLSLFRGKLRNHSKVLRTSVS